jgi:hypothetical protein
MIGFYILEIVSSLNNNIVNISIVLISNKQHSVL